MRFFELVEQGGTMGTIGSTTAPAAPSAPMAPTLGGQNAADVTDPKMQAAALAKQKQDKFAQKKQIQDQIAALQKQLADLNRTP